MTAEHDPTVLPTESPAPDCDVSIIGAGPYGLAAAAYLTEAGESVRLIGPPMDFWANRMPAGMLLRSPRAASTIADPGRLFTLEAYETAVGLPPRSPLPLETFVNYGLWFQQKIGACSLSTLVTRVTKEKPAFRLTLQNGQSLKSKRVVVAAGIGPFARKPNVFADLPSEQLSHCYEGTNVGAFAGKRVAVIGAGQSALESAALLDESGAQVEIIAKIAELRWIGSHAWLHKMGPVSSLLYSKYDVGPIGISRLVASPSLVSRVPLAIRDKIRRRAVRPAGSQWLKPRMSTVSITTGRQVRTARSVAGRVQLVLDDGTERVVDHVLLGTGYSVNVSGYDFLAPELVEQIRLRDGYPVLADGFASSVPGLHFIGATAARSFGPLLYFVAGTEFAATRLAAHIRGKRAAAR